MALSYPSLCLSSQNVTILRVMNDAISQEVRLRVETRGVCLMYP